MSFVRISFARVRRVPFRRAVCVVACVLATLLVASIVDARSPAISAVEVRSLVARSDRDLVQTLRETVERELAAVDLSKAPKNARFVLSASLVKLETTTSDRSSRATCRVSIVLRDGRGALRAILDGTALAEDATRASVETGAIEGAVHGAMRGVPEALKRVD